MAQDPYSALAGGIERGMGIAAAFQQYKDQQEQKKLDSALTGLKMHMTLMDPSMPKAANKVGLNGVIKMMSDPAISKAMGLQIPQGFDVSAIADDTKGLSLVYKEVAPIFAKAKKGEIDKGTALMLTGNVVNQYAATVTQERELMKELRAELDNAFKIPEKIEEKQAMIGAGLEETPSMRRENDLRAGLTGKQAEIDLGFTETPGQRRSRDIAAGIHRDLTRVDLGLDEKPADRRTRDREEKKDYTPQQLMDDNRAHYEFEVKRFIDPLTGTVKPENLEEYNSVLSNMREDAKRIGRGDRPSWMETARPPLELLPAHSSKKPALGGKTATPGFKSAEEVREAFNGGKLDQDTATKILQDQFGFK